MASPQVAAAPGAPSPAPTHAYTCNTCHVAYRNGDLQKGHMKSDWHHYNLKRKVASLPPISSEIFNEKVLQARAATAAQANKALFERHCEVCDRHYNSENAYNNHMSSTRHKERVLAAQRSPETAVDDTARSIVSSTFSLGEPISQSKSDVDSEAEEEFHKVVEGLKKPSVNDPTTLSPVNRPGSPRPSAQDDDDDDDEVAVYSDDEEVNSTATSKQAPAYSSVTCLFCNYDSPTVALNAHHMERFHGMFVPEKKFLVDLEGLVKHLQTKVHEKHQCITCGKSKGSAFAVQTHMRDKSHTSIPYTSMKEQLDIGDFYDFRSTYSDDEDEDSDETTDANEANGVAGKPKVPFKPKYVRLALDSRGDESEDDDEWETDDEESLASEEITAIYDSDTKYERLDKHTHHSKDDPRHHHQVDGWHSHAHKHAHAVFYDEYSLHLPSGKSVGHRSLNVYYRQNLYSHQRPEEHAERLALEAAANRAALANSSLEDTDATRRTQAIRQLSGSANIRDTDAAAMVRQEMPEKEILKAVRKMWKANARDQRREPRTRGREHKSGKRDYVGDGMRYNKGITY